MSDLRSNIHGCRKGSLFYSLKKYSGIIGLLIACFVFPVDTSAQSATKAQKKAEQRKEQQARIAKKAEEKGRKRHEAIQTKEVRKKMKRNRKRYNHVDSYDRRPNFIQRIFKRKRASSY